MTNTKRNKKRRMPALDKYVIFCFSCILIFTITQIIVFIFTGQEQTALITCFFAAFAGELLSLALIKRLKLKQEHENKKTDAVDDNIDAFG